MMVEIEHRDDAAEADQLWKRFERVVEAATSENDDDETSDRRYASGGW
jgi:hypothetical protein